MQRNPRNVALIGLWGLAILSGLGQITGCPNTSHQWDAAYDVFSEIDGYEDYAVRLACARNRQHADDIKREIDKERFKP